MIAKQMGTERASSKTIERCSAYLEDLHARIAKRFLKPEVRAPAHRYLTGLLGDVRRKNGWQRDGRSYRREQATRRTTPP